MNASTKTRTPAEQAKLDKRAKAARDKRAAAKWQTVEFDGCVYKVSAAMTPTEAANAARVMHEAHTARQNGTAEASAPEKPKPLKPVKGKGDPLATVFYRLSRSAMEALSGALGQPYRAENPKDWAILKASKKITGGQSWAFTGKLRPEAAATLATALRSIAAQPFKGSASLITNAEKLESNHYAAKAAEKRS